MEVFVFTTSVKTLKDAELIAPALNSFIGKGNWNFALDDSDKILRIISDGINPIQAIQLLEENGFKCKELED